MQRSAVCESDEMRRFSRRRVLGVLLVLTAAAVVFLGRWLNATKRGGQEPAEPFRVAGNFYYVGANDIAAFLITGSEGHVVLDAGYPTTAPMIMASIAKLGFDLKDVIVTGAGSAPETMAQVRGAPAASRATPEE